MYDCEVHCSGFSWLISVWEALNTNYIFMSDLFYVFGIVVTFISYERSEVEKVTSKAVFGQNDMKSDLLTASVLKRLNLMIQTKPEKGKVLLLPLWTSCNNSSSDSERLHRKLYCGCFIEWRSLRENKDWETFLSRLKTHRSPHNNIFNNLQLYIFIWNNTCGFSCLTVRGSLSRMKID